LTARATTFLTLQSTYLGNGWFQYQMSVRDDPFFIEADMYDLLFNFTNQIEQSTDSTNWVCTPSDGSISNWSFSGLPVARPNEQTFFVQSSKTSYRLGAGTNFDGATGAFSLEMNDFYPGSASGVWGQNIVGYAEMPCLVPCDPDQSDGSPTNYIYNLKLVPDITINSLIQTNGNISGVDFSWASQSTFVFQGSMDLLNWTNIAYLWSTPPDTTWTTNVALNAYGQFFRVALVADGYDTNLPSLGSAITLKLPAKTPLFKITTPVITGCNFSNGIVTVNFTAATGMTMYVQAIDYTGKIYQTQQLTASTDSGSARFVASELPNPVFFRIVLQ
jgi:hypothetical protein